VLIGFSWRGGEERKGDGLQFKLRVWSFRAEERSLWRTVSSAQRQLRGLPPFSRTPRSPRPHSVRVTVSQTQHTHTRALFASGASLLQQLRLVTPHRARRHASSLLRVPARRSPSPRAIMRLACRFVRCASSWRREHGGGRWGGCEQPSEWCECAIAVVTPRCA
jgi:hypothetical protein